METVTAGHTGQRAALYRMVWRWHFYAGLFVIPFILILSVTGAIYLFKPQIERWEERAWKHLPDNASVSPDAQLSAALAAFPGASFHSYRLPQQAGDAALIHLTLKNSQAGEQSMRDVFVSPQGRVIGSLDPQARIIRIDHDIHGQMLLGRRGSWLVELAASWALVMVLTGMYLWWPKGRGMAGVVWPRLNRGTAVAWRDLHAVTGFWVAGLATLLLITGLPWSDVWGSAFKALRSELGASAARQDWTIGGRAPDAGKPAVGEHAEHEHSTMMAAARLGGMAGMVHVPLGMIVARAKSEHLAFPVTVAPPRPGEAGMAWTVKSEAQNRPLRVTITYDAMTGREISRAEFADKPVADRVIGYGV
ncbi:MAG: PepSY domain-containing protein, partial [Novosphingobium sp.]